MPWPVLRARLWLGHLDVCQVVVVVGCVWRYLRHCPVVASASASASCRYPRPLTSHNSQSIFLSAIALSRGTSHYPLVIFPPLVEAANSGQNVSSHIPCLVSSASSPRKTTNPDPKLHRLSVNTTRHLFLQSVAVFRRVWSGKVPRCQFVASEKLILQRI